jgi:hypothetical protein
MMEHRSSSRQRRRYKVTTSDSSWFTADLCPDGFCAEMMRVLPLRTVVEGVIHVKETQVPFAGEVAWAKRGDWHLNLRGRMGLRFTRVGSKLALLLDQGQEDLSGREAITLNARVKIGRYRLD